MGIEGWVGRPGAGKTYTLTERAIKEAKRGRNVFTNYPVDGCWLFNENDLLDLPEGLIVIDEAHLWFSSRASLRLPPSWLAELSQTRKNGWDLIWSAQHESRVDRVIRDVSSWIWLTRAWLPRPDRRPRLFSMDCYEPEYFRNDKKRYLRRWTYFRQEVADAYDTMGRIGVARHTATANDPYAKRPGQ